LKTEPIKIKTKKYAEYILITIGYLENLLKYNPDFKNTLSLKLKPTNKGILNDYDSILGLKMVLEMIVEMPGMVFTKPIERREYYSNSIKSIQFAKKNYIDLKVVSLSKEEKRKYIQH